ncbi:unnamed protein product, partial [Ectocarpus fasciculatus]
GAASYSEQADTDGIKQRAGGTAALGSSSLTGGVENESSGYYCYCCRPQETCRGTLFHSVRRRTPLPWPRPIVTHCLPYITRRTE